MPRFPAVRPARLPCHLLVVIGLTAWLSACSPTLNWREVRPAGGGVQALLPCKPETAQRQVPLGPTPSMLHMSSCEAGGMTFALAWTELATGADVRAAQAQWQTASLQSLRATQEPARTVRDVPGAEAAELVSASGSDHRGNRIESRMVFAFRGHRLYQAAAFGATLPDEALEPFFRELQVLP